jgi:uncharacterized metal-binding protein YceD (DUF177 family)
MKNLKSFTIPFIGLKLGEHVFNFTIDNTFFKHFEYLEFNNTNIQLEVLFLKKTTMLEFTLTYKGDVSVNCDVTNEPYNQDVSGIYHFIVQFGEDYEDENEDLLIIPHGSYEVNIQQYIYESIILALPSRFIHPGIEKGTLKSDILTKLEELSPKQGTIKSSSNDGTTDPRWDTLKKLLTDK